MLDNTTDEPIYAAEHRNALSNFDFVVKRLRGMAKMNPIWADEITGTLDRLDGDLCCQILDLVEGPYENKKTPLLREMKEDLWNAECDLIAADDNENDDDIRNHLDTARDRLCAVRRDLTLLLGDEPDDLLSEWLGRQ